MTNYPEINASGLTEYHKQKLCYPYTDVPAFTFWGPPTDEVLPEGVSPMRAWQDGRCALCGFRERLVRDHCHETGLIRGLLCNPCNLCEGLSNHNFGRWRTGTTVAAFLGIEEVYVNAFGQTPMRRYAATFDLDVIAEAVTRGM